IRGSRQGHAPRIQTVAGQGFHGSLFHRLGWIRAGRLAINLVHGGVSGAGRSDAVHLCPVVFPRRPCLRLILRRSPASGFRSDLHSSLSPCHPRPVNAYVHALSSPPVAHSERLTTTLGVSTIFFASSALLLPSSTARPSIQWRRFSRMSDRKRIRGRITP